MNIVLVLMVGCLQDWQFLGVAVGCDVEFLD